MAVNREMGNQLIGWIIQRNDGKYPLEESESDTLRSIVMQAPYAKVRVNVHFLEYMIAEYTIEDGNGENAFYFHFELTDPDHAKDVYMEMEECLKKLGEKKTRKILLCCSCGLTTSYFTMRLNEIAKLTDADMEFSAVPYEQLFENARDKDAVLIAPQIGYRLKSVQDVLKDKIVIKIPVSMFSTYDGAGVINLLKETFEAEEKKETEKAESSGLRKIAGMSGSTLVVSIVFMEGRNQIAYRVYDGERITAENQITKETYQLTDILDVIRTAVVMNTDLSRICVVTPGMISGGKLTYERFNIIDYDIVSEIKAYFSGNVLLLNVTDMIALGYAHADGHPNSAFYFVPTGSHTGNIGIVVNGELILNDRHMGGRQLEFVTDITAFPMNPYALMRTPEGNTELAARYITGLFSYTGIEHIAFYSSMIPEEETLREKVRGFIPEQYMPQIVKVHSVRDYLYDGALYVISTR